MARGRPGIKIFCVNDNNIFNSIAEASAYYGVASSSISKQLKGERTTAGGYHFIKIQSGLTDNDLQQLRETELRKIYNID